MPYGLEAVDNIVTSGKVPFTQAPQPLPVEGKLLPPQTRACNQAYDHVRNQLPEEIVNHCSRVFAFGMAILNTQDFDVDPETFYLAALFHDIAASPKNITATKLSFEFYGGILAREWLLDNGVTEDRVDSVVEAIFRHTLFTGAKIHACGQLLQLATTVDVLGSHKNLVHDDTIDNVVKAYPRLQWNEYFAKAMDDEIEAKPGCLTTIGGSPFISGIRNNKVMEKYDSPSKL